MQRNQKNAIIINENPKEIYMFEDYFKVTKECRESYYYLNSIFKLFRTHVTMQKDFSQEKYNKIVERHKEANHLFDTLEKILNINKQDNETEITSNLIAIDPIICYKSIKDYIKCKLFIDRLQLDILNHLIIVERTLCDELGKEIPTSDLIRLETAYLLHFPFDCSVEEDKIINYHLICKDKQYSSALQKQGIVLPERLNIRDYNYILEKRRDELRHWKKTFTEIITVHDKFKNEKQNKILNEQQLKLNKNVTRMTVVLTILTVIMTVLTVVTTYYTWIDHK